jgi:predicted nuclease with TOPRIM domain
MEQIKKQKQKQKLEKYETIINLLKNRLPGIEQKTKLIVEENSSLKEENGRLREDNNELKTKITIKTPNSLGFQQLKEQIKNLKNENSKVTNEKYEKEIELDDEINKLKNRIKELNDEIELTKQL